MQPRVTVSLSKRLQLFSNDHRHKIHYVSSTRYSNRDFLFLWETLDMFKAGETRATTCGFVGSAVGALLATLRLLSPLQLEHNTRNGQTALILKTVPLRATRLVTTQRVRRHILPVSSQQLVRRDSRNTVVLRSIRARQLKLSLVAQFRFRRWLRLAGRRS